MDLSNAIIAILQFSRTHAFWSFPTNPISALFYFSFSLYGYVKLRHHVKPRLLAFLYAVCILGAINFIMENVWLTMFYMRFHFFNNGWLQYPYLMEPWGWLLNYYRNIVVMTVLYLVSREAWKHVKFTKRTLFSMIALSIFLFLYFFLTSSYAQVDWGYGLFHNFSKDIIVNGFLLSVLGKPILFDIYRSVWRVKNDVNA